MGRKSKVQEALEKQKLQKQKDEIDKRRGEYANFLKDSYDKMNKLYEKFNESTERAEKLSIIREASSLNIQVDNKCSNNEFKTITGEQERYLLEKIRYIFAKMRAKLIPNTKIKF